MPYSVKEIMKKNDRRWLDLKVCEETNPDLKRSICWDSDPGSGLMVEYTVEGIMSQYLRSCDLKVYSKNYNGELLKRIRIRWLLMKCHYSKVGSMAGKYIPVACGFGKAGTVLQTLSAPCILRIPKISSQQGARCEKR